MPNLLRRLRSSRVLRTSLLAPLLALPFVGGTLSAGCGDDDPSAGDDVEPTPQLRPGDVCAAPQPNLVRGRFSPARIFVPPCPAGATGCTTREVELIVEPDVCTRAPIELVASSPELNLPASPSVTLYQGTVVLSLNGTSTPGSHTITARIPRGDGTSAEALLEVEVLPEAAPVCSGSAISDASLEEAETLAGQGGLAGASIGLPNGANTVNAGSDLWNVDPFPATVGCGTQALPAGYRALGPAIEFGPKTLKFRRDVPMSVPVNPALMPSAARFRHLRVLHSSPKFPEPRVVPVADPRFELVGGTWALSFKAPRLGTYQAVVAEDAGTAVRKRRIMHRAVIGVSMGGMGSSMFGTRHHDKFDVIAPLGGPATWGWLMDHIQKNHMGGFRRIAPGTTIDDIATDATLCDTDANCANDETCLGKTSTNQGRCTLLPEPTDPYEHPQTFNHWWAEYPRTGTGGSFPRQDYAQIFRDLALGFGNPNGDNLAPGGEHLPPGVPPTHPSVRGNRSTDECAVWVDPISDHPDNAKQKELQQNCPTERCANTLVLDNYYDDEFNPDGTFPVITVCDGTPTSQEESPWANAWKPEAANDYPLEVALAVDYNGNGKRDALEPVIRSGHEPWQDVGTDGLASVDEPGYVAGVNEDPNGDDYDAQFNPGGTEGDHRYQEGEPFLDVGIDGVAGTPQQPANGWQQAGDGYDVGEGDGKFTVARGLARMWGHDPAGSFRGDNTELPGGPIDDAALSRLDVWTDGGLRDIFNFHVGAQHLAGSLASRGRDTAYYSDFSQIPGFDPLTPNQFSPALIPWKDVPGSVLLRYGMIDPDAVNVENGNGQHVGTVLQITGRLQSALYYIGSRWTQPELRTLVSSSGDKPMEGLPNCEIDGACNFEFTDSTGRKGPVAINFPPGYGHADQQDRRYPVIYMLHGYGMTPEDLGAAIVFVANWMNNGADGMASRLPKAILVYVDGRCRPGADGRAECIRGNFYVDSPRSTGHEAEKWWLELMDHVDANYRTLPPTEIDWAE